MSTKKEIITYAVSMILKAALLAAVWAGKIRKRGLESIAKLPFDEKDRTVENLCFGCHRSFFP